MAAATLTEILDDLNDYADFEAQASVARAQSFITAAMRFLQLPSSEASQGASQGYAPEQVAKQLEYARAYVRANQTTTARNARVRFLGVGSDFR